MNTLPSSTASAPPAEADATGAVNRIRALDVFRALAILAVIAFHYLYRWATLGDAADTADLSTAYPLFRLGGLGVEFFFIISGFVIYMTLERCRSLPQFFMRRFARLYPAYVLTMLLVFAIGNCCGPAPFHHSWHELLVGLTMAAPHFRVAWIDGVYWSLLAEITFYFWVGLLFLIGGCHFERWWSGFVLGSSLLAHWAPHFAGGWLAAANLPFFTVGMYYYRRHAEPARRATHLWLCAAMAYLLTWHAVEWRLHLIVATMIVAFMAMNRGWLNWLTVRPLLLLGEISYSLYLVHENIGVTIIRALREQFRTPNLLAAAAAFMICAALAFAVTRLIESPGKAWITSLANRWLLPWLDRQSWSNRLAYAVAPPGPRNAG